MHWGIIASLTAASAVMIYILSGILAGRHLARIFAFPKTRSLEYTWSSGIEEKEFTAEQYEAFGFTPFTIDSDGGYQLQGVFLRGSDPKKTALFVHGHTWTWHGMIKYFIPYLERGYSIAAYNQRYHGDSGGSCCTAGLSEKQDLMRAADWAFETFPETKVFGVMGESLGGAVVLQYLPLDPRLSFVHADCPYSDGYNLFRHHLRLSRARILEPIALKYCDHFFRTRCDFSMDRINPREDILKAEVPLLLVHGSDDDYVPTSMSITMAEERRSALPPGLTRLELMPGAGHGKSLTTDPVRYTRVLSEFLDDVESRVTADQG